MTRIAAVLNEPVEVLFPAPRDHNGHEPAAGEGGGEIG
jgi:hypothetical protein